MSWIARKSEILRATESLRGLLFSSNLLTSLFFTVDVRSSPLNLAKWDLTTVALRNALDKYVKNGQRILEVGTGPFAVLSIYVAKNKRVEVTAVDIYPDFIENAIKTAKYNGVLINFVESDLLSDVKSLFDIVFFNPPYLPEESFGKVFGKNRPNYFPLVCNGGPDGCETIRRFLEQVSAVMHENSKVLLGVNTWFVRARSVEELIHENDLRLIFVFSSLWNPSRVFVIEGSKKQSR